MDKIIIAKIPKGLFLTERWLSRIRLKYLYLGRTLTEEETIDAAIYEPEPERVDDYPLEVFNPNN